jgi:hypothetical protein
VTSDAKIAERLTKLQRRIAEQKRLEWTRHQYALTNLQERREALAKTLEEGGLAWQMFPEMSSRHLGNLVSGIKLAKEATDRAARISVQEAKRLERLEQKTYLLQRSEELRKDDEQRLENAVRRSRSSLPQA